MRIYQSIGMVCLGLLASNSYSQQDPVEVKQMLRVDLPCFDSKKVFQSLLKEFNERPLIYGKANDLANSKVSIWFNSKDKSWTILATVDDTTCLIGSGTDLVVVPKEFSSSK